MLFITLARVLTLTLYKQWREDLQRRFPTECISHAANGGCTRVTLSEKDCTRALDIETENSIVFLTNDDQYLNS